MIREVGNTVDANECTVEIGLLLVIWSSLLFSPAFPLLILPRTLSSSLYLSLTTRSLLAVPHPHLPHSSYCSYFVSFFFPISFPPPHAFSLVHYFYAHSLLLLLKFDQSNSVSFYPLIIWISLVLSLFLGYPSLLFPLLF
jgi:hypothetical protein